MSNRAIDFFDCQYKTKFKTINREVPGKRIEIKLDKSLKDTIVGGSGVAKIQGLLLKLQKPLQLDSPGIIDNVNGPKTKRAIRSFQKAVDLDEDDRATHQLVWDLLYNDKKYNQ